MESETVGKSQHPSVLERSSVGNAIVEVYSQSLPSSRTSRLAFTIMAARPSVGLVDELESRRKMQWLVRDLTAHH